jgi:hypothetical protein
MIKENYSEIDSDNENKITYPMMQNNVQNQFGLDIQKDNHINKQTVPEKFWDDENDCIRIDSLIKSYIELEKKLGETRPIAIPVNPDDYNINIKNDLITCDPLVNRRLHAANFNQEQVQLVYDLACEYMMPLVTEIASVFEAEGQVARLVQHFGSEDRWREMAHQIDTWGRSHLPDRVFEVLSTTCEGILTMHRMMSGGEPGLIKSDEHNQGFLSESQLRTMMRDPRYWRDHESSIVAKVREGFRTLYNE